MFSINRKRPQYNVTWMCPVYWLALRVWPLLPKMHCNGLITQSINYCMWGRSGRISRSGLTQDIRIGSCVFQSEVPHQWIAQRQVDPVSVYCDVGSREHSLFRNTWFHRMNTWFHILCKSVLLYMVFTDNFTIFVLFNTIDETDYWFG